MWDHVSIHEGMRFFHWRKYIIINEGLRKDPSSVLKALSLVSSML